MEIIRLKEPKNGSMQTHADSSGFLASYAVNGWVTCNPRSIMAFLSLRTNDETAKFVSYPLYEIEVAARIVEDIFSREWPLTYKAFVENGRVGP